MDPSKLKVIACVNFPPVTVSQIVLDLNCLAESHDHGEINRSTANNLCKQILKLSTREIRKSIKSIVSEWKEKSPKIYSLVRREQCYFGIDEDFVLKNMKDILPQFFCCILSNDSSIYCESLCEFSRLIAREIAIKINNRIAMALSETTKTSCDISTSYNAMIGLIVNITNCMRLKMCQCAVQQGEGNTSLLLDTQEGKTQMVISKDSCDIVYSTSQKAVMDILIDTSSITCSHAEIQELCDNMDDYFGSISNLRSSEESGTADDENSGNEYSDDENSGDENTDAEDDSDQDPDEDMDDKCKIISNLRSSEESGNADDENSGNEYSDDENSGDENTDAEDDSDQDPHEDMDDKCKNISGDEYSHDEHSTSSEESGNAEDESSDESRHCEAGVDSDSRTTVKSRQYSDVQTPSETTSMTDDDVLHMQICLVITGLVVHCMKKAPAALSMKDSCRIVKNLLQKAKRHIKLNDESAMILKNVEKIRKAVYKDLVKKIGSAKYILRVMETQMVDNVFIETLRIHLTTPKRKGAFSRFFSSMGKFLRKSFCGFFCGSSNSELMTPPL